MLKKLLFAAVFVAMSLSIFAQSADELIEKSVKAHGFEKMKAFKSLYLEGEMGNAGMPEPFKFTYKVMFPDKIRMDLNVMGQDISQALESEEKGWMSQGGQIADLPPQAINSLRQPFSLVTNPYEDLKKEMDTIQFIGEKDFNGTKCNAIKLTPKDGGEMYLMLDPITNLFVGQQIVMEEGVIDIVVVEKGKVKGVIIPKSVEIKQNGEKVASFYFDVMKADENVSESDFVRPQK